jgi:hypothetical protein
MLRLLQHLAAEFELNINLWSLSALQNPALARLAATDAAHAALMIIAINGDKVLPPSVKSWISRCARRIQSAGGVLAAQLHGISRMNHELAPAYGCLKHIATDAGVGFFSEVIDPADNEDACRIEEIHRRANTITPVLEAIPQRP